LLTTVLYGLFRAPAKRVIAAGGIAKLVGKKGQHGLKHARVERRGRVIVHVNRQLHSHCLVLLFRR
jgi:hypothetical protein